MESRNPMGRVYAENRSKTQKPLGFKGFYPFTSDFLHTHAPWGFCDSIFKVNMESAAVLKHLRLEFTGNIIVTLSFCFIELQ